MQGRDTLNPTPYTPNPYSLTVTDAERGGGMQGRDRGMQQGHIEAEALDRDGIQETE
jgi:hypothetical protein